MIIQTNVYNELEINKSKFLTFIYKIKSLEEVNKYLENLKKEYKDAIHICFAYIINNHVKYNDDGEPTGTAGIPILEVLKKNNLNFVVAFVVRYFGGIKLGSNGLTKAYSNSISLALKKTDIIELEILKKIKLTLTYQENKLLEKTLKEYKILDKQYNEKITYTILANEKLIEKLNSYNLNIEIINEEYF